MFALVNRGELPGTTEHEFEQLTTRLKTFLLVEHNEDGTHTFDIADYATIEYVDDEIDSLSAVYAPLVHTHAAADIVSGELAKARQHAQTAYKDEANTFTASQTFSATRPELQLLYTGNTGKARIVAAGNNGNNLAATTNLSFDGTDWNADDTTLTGARLALFSTNELVYQNTTTGANPRTLTERFRVGADGALYERARATALGEWTTYTPTWTNVTVGNGTVTAKYTQIGKTVVVHVVLSFGSTTAVTGSVSFTVPVNINDANMGHGVATYLDTGVAWFQGAIQPISGTTVSPGYTSTTAGAIGPVTSTTPFTWVTGDRMIFTLIYEGV